jgi:hypothetical protein
VHFQSYLQALTRIEEKHEIAHLAFGRCWCVVFQCHRACAGRPAAEPPDKTGTAAIRAITATTRRTRTMASNRISTTARIKTRTTANGRAAQRRITTAVCVHRHHRRNCRPMTCPSSLDPTPCNRHNNRGVDTIRTNRGATIPACSGMAISARRPTTTTIGRVVPVAAAMAGATRPAVSSGARDRALPGPRLPCALWWPGLLLLRRLLVSGPERLPGKSRLSGDVLSPGGFDDFLRISVHQHFGPRVGGVNRVGGLIADAVGD